MAFSLIEKFRFVLANGSSVIYDASCQLPQPEQLLLPLLLLLQMLLLLFNVGRLYIT